MIERYAYGVDEESFTGDFDTPEAAARAGFEEFPKRMFMNVGVKREPLGPDVLIHADAMIEMVQQHEDYSIEAAGDWPGCSEEQKEELTAEIRKVIADWMDRNRLRPRFFIVEKPVEMRREDVMPGGAAPV